MEMSTETKHCSTYDIIHVLLLALDCADCFFFVTHINHVFGILEVFALQFCSENSLHGPQQGLLRGRG